jgi:hypothetical protein
MTAVNTQVVTLFEDARLSPEQIAEDLGYDLVAVKATLLQFSSVYRATVKKEDKDEECPQCSDAELDEMFDVIKNHARYAENEAVSLKAACRIIDEKKGRLGKVNEVRAANFNLIQFNQTLIENRRNREKILERKVEELVA